MPSNYSSYGQRTAPAPPSMPCRWHAKRAVGEGGMGKVRRWAGGRRKVGSGRWAVGGESEEGGRWAGRTRKVGSGQGE